MNVPQQDDAITRKLLDLVVWYREHGPKNGLSMVLTAPCAAADAVEPEEVCIVSACPEITRWLIAAVMSIQEGAPAFPQLPADLPN